MKRLYVLLLICAAWLPSKAQVDVSIQILPPYPTKITDYASRPQLMVISVRNRSGVSQRIQLRGAVTGDNGVELRVRNSYKSISPIVLRNNEVRMLNGADLKYFFDYTKIDYKGITQSEFINKNGLPEGTYRFCIRAYDYDSNAPISADEPVGCSNTFTVSSLEPPTIIAPMADANLTSTAGQTVLMQWTTPPGTSPNIMSAVRYRIRMVEIIGNKNPNNAIMSATQPYFFEKVVMGNSYVYNAADPQLTPGRRYAFMVEAYDPFNATPFRNNGRSEVRAFTYTAPPNTFLQPLPPLPGSAPTQHPIMATIDNTTPTCECKAEAGTGASNNSKVVPLAVVDVGNFKMHVAKATTGANGLVSGEGTMELPFVGSTLGARLRVTFTDMDVNANLKMKSGQVKGMLSGQAPGFMPTADGPNTPNLQMDSAKAKSLKDYFATAAGSMWSELKTSGNSLGFQLPLGISKGPVTIAISYIYFTATQAWFEANASVDIPDGGRSNILGLTGRNICISSLDGFCKEGQLYLSQDFNISALKMVLKAAGPNPLIEPGTFVSFNKYGIQKLTIKADYTFPDGSLIDSATNKPLTATLTGQSNPGSTAGWADWMGKLSVPAFYVKGMQSINFSLNGKDMFYDHSDFQRPPGIPASFPSPDGSGAPINTGDYLWHGFYIPQITVSMPQIIKNTLNNKSVGIQGTQLIFDNNGFSGNIQNTGTLLELGNGSMDGWYASIDKVNLKFFRSGFKESSITGRLVLPASDKAKKENELTYTGSLTTPGTGGLAYSFNLAPTNNNELTFDMLLMTVRLNNSSITVSGDTKGSPLKAEAILNGSLSVSNDPLSKVKVPGIGNLSLPHIEFNNLKFMTTKPFIGPGMTTKLVSGPVGNNNGGGGGGSPQNNMGFDYIPQWDDLAAGNTDLADGLTNAASVSGPQYNAGADRPAQQYDGSGDNSQQKLVGFDFTAKLSGIEAVLGNNGAYGVGFNINGGLAIGAGPITCQADANILFSSTIHKEGNRIIWDGVNAAIKDISLAAGVDMGPFKIKGAIKYYNNHASNESDEGFVGALQTNLAGFLTLNMRGQFGTKTEGTDKYNYFNFNALADFGQAGITFAPPVPLAIYGFGGGFYYNMNLDPKSLPDKTTIPHTAKTADVDDVPKEAPASDSDPKASDSPMDLLNYNPAKLSLVPSKGASGFNATILFGLTSRNTLDADATFGMGFTAAGGLENIYIDANSRLLTDVSQPLNIRDSKSTGVGHLRIEYKTDNHTFLAHLDAEFGVPYVGNKNILYARGGGEFFADDNDWYLKIGQPEGYGMGPNYVRLLNFIEGDSYFEVGTDRLVDPMPPVPKIVRDLVGYGEKDQQDQIKNSEAGGRHYSVSGDSKGGHGVILGSSLKIGKEDTEYHFLMFYGTLVARMGFDLSLRPQATCSGIPGAGGTGGWYAQGQAYFGAQASLGIDIDLFLIKAKFSIFEAGAAALVRAGLPNPTWAEGAIGGRFSILDGAIQSDFNFHFNVGDDPCIDASASPFGGLQLISQVVPEANGQKQPLSAMPAVVFNVKAGGQFKGSNYINGYFDFDDFENADQYGNAKKRFFLFDKSCITAKLNGNVITDDLVRLDKDGFSLGYQSPTYLPKNTDFTFRVEAKMKEGFVSYNDILHGNLTASNYEFILDGTTKQVAMQHKESTFTTDNGFSTIPSSEYAMTAPLHSHKAVPTNEFGGLPGGLMYIETKKVIDKNNFFTYPEGTTYKARVFRNGVRDGADIEVNMETVTNRLKDGVKPNTNSQGNVIHSAEDAHSRWSFKGPALQKGSDYTVVIIAKAPNNNADTNAPATVLTSQANNAGSIKIGGQQIDGFNINTLVRKLGNNVNKLSSGEGIAAGFSFHTGNYGTYQEKLDSLRLTKIVHKTMGSAISPDRNKGQNLAALNGWNISSAQNKYNINLGKGMGLFNFPVDITLVGELFSKADLYGTNSDEVFQANYDNYGNGIRRNISIAPLFKGRTEYNYGENYKRLKAFISANTTVPFQNITVTVNSPGKAEDKGIMYCYITGGISEEFTGNQTNIGAPLPDNLPQVANTAQATSSGGMIMVMIPGFTIQMPVMMSSFAASNLMCKTRGQLTFTDPIQRQIDKVKNWAVNPGDNMSTPGIVMNNPGTNLSNVAVWENVSNTASGLVSGGINQGQLEGAIKGAVNKAGALR